MSLSTRLKLNYFTSKHQIKGVFMGGIGACQLRILILNLTYFSVALFSMPLLYHAWLSHQMFLNGSECLYVCNPNYQRLKVSMVERRVPGMAAFIRSLYLRALFLFILVFVSTLGQNLQSCDTTSPAASGYYCNGNGSQEQCGTFALLRTNSYYSSLFNLSFFLGIDRLLVAEANGFSGHTEFLPYNQPLLIPIDCKCKGGFFQAELIKTTIKGESFFSIAESLEGLTTCKAIRENNPSVQPWGLADKVKLLIPMRCACPSSSELTQETELLLSYPVTEGDTVSSLAFKFNTTSEAIISANNRSGSGAALKLESLAAVSSLLIPLRDKPSFGSPAKPRETNIGLPATSIPVIGSRKKKPKMWKIGVYIAVTGVAVGASIAIAAAFLVIHWKRKKQSAYKMGDVELQQLGLSVRTTSEKKVSFEGSQDPIDHIIDSTPHKIVVETYTLLELRKATEDFNSSNLIEGSVFHGRLNGKNLAIKRTQPEAISKIEFGLFHDAIHHHPNIMRLLGTCLSEGPDSYLIFEYAKNGSLKDWLHGGLAMKSQFIASCYCFLTWNQRIRICLDVAMALQYMHHIMHPSYVHRSIKTRNIFIDEEFNAKIGNFGMARCSEDEAEDSQSYSAPSWSKGYSAPEYAKQGIISPAMDIFAYGVVLLEILSGKTPISRAEDKGGGSVWLAEKIKSILRSENTEELRGWMDSALGESYSFDAAITLANLARACTDENPCSRPSAGEIVEKLSRMVEQLPEGEQFSVCESSSKPLVKAAANSL